MVIDEGESFICRYRTGTTSFAGPSHRRRSSNRPYTGKSLNTMQPYTLTLVYILLATVVSNVARGNPLSFIQLFAHGPADGQDSADRQDLGENSNYRNSIGFRDYAALSDNAPKYTRPWSRIIQSPVGVMETSTGSRVELECKARGSPPPQILWFTGSGTEEQLKDFVRTSTDDISEPTEEWQGIGEINSKLVIECVTPEHQGLIYCASISEAEIQISSPAALLINGERGTNCSNESGPTITLQSPTRFSNIGTTIVLPCRASGKPMPHIHWEDNNGVPLSISTNARHRILNSGDLLIENLQWSDMGGYTCTATSGHREESLSTFLYPMLPSNRKPKGN
ncbi:hypothetical protein KM043_008954 [Ampulex compressa]|nr:hypothetical protein KM043_008954 [Ampulex compressa]